LNIELSLKILGVLLWLLLTQLMSAGLESESWIVVLLMFSLLFLMSLSRRLLEVPEQVQRRERASMSAAVLLGISFCWMPTPGTALLTLPWLMIRLLSAYDALRECRTQGWLSLSQACVLAARVFPAIGAAWLVAHRANWTPFGFDPLIVLLTAAHFHHAGFTLPLIAGLHGKARSDGLACLACAAVLAGVPLVAAGITCTHFGVVAWMEPLGVSLLVLGSLTVAVLQLRLAWQREQPLSHRMLLGVSGMALMTAMVLALCFGLRHVLPGLALTMPQMWALHGSLNVFGFGLCGLLGWCLMNSVKA